MTKFNKQELISNYPNCTCINPKLNSNKPILCSKLGMHPTEAEGQKPVSGVMQLVKMLKSVLSGKRHNTNRHNAKRHNANRHKANRHNAKRHNAKWHNANIISGLRKELGIRESRTTRAFVSFCQCSEKMVVERVIPSSSTQNVLTQYLRRIFTLLLRQEENDFESDYVSFRLPFKSSLFALCLFELSLFALCLFALCLFALSLFR